MIVLDASALLAFLFREEGAEKVAGHLASSCISAVNYAEVLGRFIRDNRELSGLQAGLAKARILVVGFTRDQACLAAELLPHTSPLGLSLGDRACLALAWERNLCALTADKAWEQLKLPVEIRCIR